MALHDFLINRLKKYKAELNGNISEDFSAKKLMSVLSSLSNGGTNKTLTLTDTDGSLIHYSNVYTTDDGTTIKLLTTGTATKITQEGANGSITFMYYTGTANDTISLSSWISIGKIGISMPLHNLGVINSCIEFQTTMLPPTIKSGIRENKGILYNLTADYNMALTDSLLSSYQALDTYCWYRVVQDSRDGSFKYILAFDTTSVVTGSTADTAITSISVSGTTMTIAVASNTGIAAGNIIVLKNTNGGSKTYDGVYKIVSTAGAGPYTIVVNCKSGLAVGPLSGGTYTTYYRIQTLHGGTTNVTTDADVEKFTPSPSFCSEANGYYLDSAGVPTSSATAAIYRQIGLFYVHAGPVVEYVISYKSGRNKNDNFIKTPAIGAATFATNNLRITIPTSFVRIWGSDHICTDDGTNGFRVTMNSSIKARVSMPCLVTTAGILACMRNGQGGSEVIGQVNSSAVSTDYVPITGESIFASSDWIDFVKTGGAYTLSALSIGFDL